MLRASITPLLWIAALVVAPSTSGQTVTLPTAKPHGAKTLVVDIKRGRDSNPGTSRKPFKSVAAAWNSIPEKKAVARPVKIIVKPGRYAGTKLPNYWESHWGTSKAPIVVTSAKPGTV